MEFKESNAVGRSPEHGFKEGKRRAQRCGENAGLGAAFGLLGVAVGIPDDAAADAVLGAAGTDVEEEGADGDVELRAAAGGEEADGAGVGLARRRFEIGDDPHGARLGRAGDGGGRKRRREDFGNGRVGFGGDGGNELPDGGEFFRLAQAEGLDGAGTGDAAEVVARHVDDHEVFGAVFRAGAERGELRAVLGGGASARRGALHGARFEARAVETEEQFRRGTAEAPRAGGNIGAVRGALGADQREKRRPGILFERVAPEAVGEIDLIGIAGPDVAFDFAEGAAVGVGIDVGAPVVWQGGGVRRQVDGFGVFIKPEPEQGQGAGRTDGEGGIEGGRGFVGNPAGGVEPAGFDGMLDVAEARQDVFGAGGGKDFDRIQEPEPSAGSRVAEDDEVIRGAGGLAVHGWD